MESKYSKDYWYINELFSDDALEKIKNNEDEVYIRMYNTLWECFIEGRTHYRSGSP